jgi:nucleotide-binding universal stress UspA family protein
MQPFKSILVDVDASVATHPALDRAVRIARACGAGLTIADVVTIPPDVHRYLEPGLEEEYVNRRRHQLDQVVRGVAGVPAEPALLSGRPGTALIREVLRGGHDLLMRSHARDIAARGSRPYGPVDMELFRQCPCPVMVVGPGAHSAHPRVLGAVHASTDDAGEQALNMKIVELTLLLARLEHGSPMVLQAWTPFAEPLVRSHYSTEAFTAYVDDVRRRATADLERLADASGGRLGPGQIQLRRGQPEDVIPEFVVAEGIDLVVMGTMARSGIAGLFIGNTAERVLRRMPCSVLAVKPDGFVSPVRPGD